MNLNQEKAQHSSSRYNNTMDLRSLLKRLYKFLALVWDLLTKPFETLPRAEENRLATITAAFLLLSALGVLLEQIVGGNTPLIALVFLNFKLLYSANTLV